MQGIVLIDKPSGWTSFDVVNKVRRLVAVAEGKKPKHCKVGHTGTLDPLATGLLVILVGKQYTRLAQDLTKHDKTYEVTMKLGETSTTGDNEGKKTPVNTRIPSENDILTACAAFTGNIMQTPPAYSAIKIDGKRAYDLARAGKTVELAARPVTIHELRLTKYAYPEVYFTAVVSSGTYIRSLVEDIGQQLGTGAYMAGLRRTTVGKYQLTNALTMESLSIDTLEQHLEEV